MRRYRTSLLLALIGVVTLTAWAGTEALDFAAALPVLVGEPGTEVDIAKAGALIVARLIAVALGPAALLAAGLDALVVAGSRSTASRKGKGPTPEPVGSTGGGL